MCERNCLENSIQVMLVSLPGASLSLLSHRLTNILILNEAHRNQVLKQYFFLKLNILGILAGLFKCVYSWFSPAMTVVYSKYL